MEADKSKTHLRILKDAQVITNRYLELKDKSKVAKEFGISSGGVDSALFHAGHKELCGKSFLKRVKAMEEKLKPSPISEKPVVLKPDEGTLQVRAMAAELLTRVVEAINQYDKVFSEAKFWKAQADDLGARLKKEHEERERILRVHNEMVKQSNGGKLPTVEEVVRVLRREHTPGRPL